MLHIYRLILYTTTYAVVDFFPYVTNRRNRVKVNYWSRGFLFTYLKNPPIRVNISNSFWVDLFTYLPYLQIRYRILPRNLRASLLIFSVFHQLLLLILRCLSSDPLVLFQITILPQHQLSSQ